MTGSLIGTVPVWELSRLAYRSALDGAIVRLGMARAPVVICNAPGLAREVRQRGLLADPWAMPADAALWIEPLVDTWSVDLATLDGALIAGAPLTIVASSLLARILTRHQDWPDRPIGWQPGGIQRLQCGLVERGFTLEAIVRIWTPRVIGGHLFGRLAAWLGRPDIGDRLSFAARLFACVEGGFAAASTALLLDARKGSPS